MLIDAWRKVGLDGIAQVDLDEHRNRHQPLSALAPMALTVLATIARRLSQEGRLVDAEDVRGRAGARAGGTSAAGPRERGVSRSTAEPGGARARCLYLDLDSTLLGRGASMLHDGEGNVTIDGVRAVQACLRAGVEVVLMSGRRRAQVMEDARLLGQPSYIFEAGACVVLDGEEHWLTGELMPGELTIAEQIERSGAPALLLEHYAGRLEYHEPWHLQREVSHLFRGLVDASDVDRVLGGQRPREPAAGGQRRRQPALARAG